MTRPLGDNQTDLLLGDLERVITDYSRSDKRSQQRSVGPSELGVNCTRRLAMTLLGTEPVNGERDEWTSSVGTALHTWMQAAFLHANALLLAQGLPARWLVEATVPIEPGLDGHCDAYDIWTHTVLDHKFPGVTSIRKYRKAIDPHTGRPGYPSKQYEWQLHTYGLGWARMGFPVRKVAIAMYPRSGLLRDTWLWSTDYDESIAQLALAHKDQLLIAMNIADNSGSLPGFLNQLKRDTEYCTWCPYFKAGGPSVDPVSQCGGPFEEEGYVDPRHMRIPGLLA